MSVMATNIGSSATMLGNPVGILIGTKAGLTFNDFIKWATPVTAMCIIATLIILLLVFRRDIHLLSERLEARRNEQLGLGPLVRIPYRRGLLILISAVTLIALHHTIEEKLGVARNTILLVAPLAIAGILMVYRHKRARHYIESEVEWWTLLFFMMLFSVAGALEHTGITKNLADKFVGSVGHHKELLTPLIISVTALGSAFVDNIVFVAAFIPVVKQLDQTVLYWALLFGACFGGNITAIGSTANIVALGMLEKRHRIGISFMEWLKVGALIGLVTSLIAWGSLVAMQHIFPHHLQIKHSERPQQSQVIDGNESVTDKPSANDAVLVVPEEN
jgi:Na+/H+ antiporter NhaD/arsenite permease-like protein